LGGKYAKRVPGATDGWPGSSKTRSRAGDIGFLYRDRCRADGFFLRLVWSYKAGTGERDLRP